MLIYFVISAKSQLDLGLIKVDNKSPSGVGLSLPSEFVFISNFFLKNKREVS